jgi:hypothetical protein
MTAEKNPFAKFLTHFDNGQVLFHEGDDGDDMYIIQSGRVAIKKKVKDGDTTLAVLEKGDFFGEMAILERMPRSATAEVVEAGDLIVISGKQSIRLRETNRQVESLMAGGALPTPSASEASPPVPATSGTLQAEAKAYFISPSTGNVFPVFSNEALLGRFDSVTGQSPEVDLTKEDQSRNISRRHARLVVKDGKFFIAEEIGTMNGTFLNGKKLSNGVLTPIKDGDEITLCRLVLNFKTPR